MASPPPSGDSSHSTAGSATSPSEQHADGSAASEVTDGSEDSYRRLRDAFSGRFSIDTRALATFRVLLGCLVIGDLLLRGRYLQTFYTDAGTLPRAALAELYPTLTTVSIHTLSGELWVQASFFVLSGCLAVGLTVGYWTRLMTVGTFLLHASLYARNPYVLNGGDGLLILALLLGVFLPLGERWSLDASRIGPPRERIVSLATVTVLLQLVIIYTTNALFKQRSDAWTSGQAVQYALELEQFSVLAGPYLTEFPTLLTAINWLWLAMLSVSALLVLATGWRRVLVVAGFAVAHLGMLLTMRLGLFPLVVVALLVLYLPESVWARVDRQLATTRSHHEWPSLNRAVERLRSVRRPHIPASIRRSGRLFATVFLTIVLVTSVLWPATALGVAEETAIEPAVETDGYTWTLFAPNTPTNTVWFVAPATFDTGDQVDAFDGSAVDWDPPADANAAYPDPLWHRYLNDMHYGSETELEYLAAYLCDNAGGNRATTPENVTVYAVQQPIDAVGGGNPTRIELFHYECE